MPRPRSPYYFDKTIARHAVEFFPRFLRLTIAEWARRPFELSPWQKHHTAQIFGWRRRDGTRRYRKVRGFVPKKNGKTEWFAGIGHILTVGDNEPGAEVYSYATDKAQASIIYNRACNMVTLDHDRFGNPGPLARLYDGSSKTALFCGDLLSSFKPLSGDPTGKHGLMVHGALGDEAHEWRDGKLHQFLLDGMAGRRQPLDCIFTTAGTQRSYARGLYEDAKAIIADPSLDPECYAFVYEAGEDDDWTSPKVWAKANPNFGVSPKSDFIAAQCRDARRNPAKENDFKRYHLGLWTEQTTRWFAMHQWKANSADPTDAGLWKKLFDRMRGRRCWAALDLASIDDITALVLLFPPDNPGGRYVLLPFFFVPDARIEDRDRPAHPYRRWVADGALLTTPGNVTDYAFVEKKVAECGEAFRLRHSDPKDDTQFDIAIDRWNATQVAVNLGNVGFKVALFGQGFASMGAPSKELERLFASGQLEHGNHPVLKWMFGNAAFKKDPAGNKKPDKAAAADKIDGVTGGVMSLGIYMRANPKAFESIYGKRGALVV